MSPSPSDALDTERLIEQVRAGDRRAFAELLRLYRPYLRRIVELRLDPKLRPRVDPSDIVQEAQIEAARRLEAYLADTPMPFPLWLRQLAYDRLVMTHRRHVQASRRSIHREVALPEHSSLVLARQLFATGSTPSQKLEREDLVSRVRQAVAQLADADREILLMRTFEGLSFEEVGCLLAIDAAAARKRHGRALLRLHKLLSASAPPEALP
jgi:RNA polymerase sigma-70 factor (ECF subfamily)